MPRKPEPENMVNKEAEVDGPQPDDEIEHK
jgi:hypothetical protein